MKGEVPELAASVFSYTTAMLIPALLNALAHVSRVCGFDTVDSFPPGHQYARTRWNPAYFDIASDMKPEGIERALCESIANTPLIFAHITHPTPRMQRALLAVIDTRLRRSCANPLDLVGLLVHAYRSPATPDAMPGLRATIESSQFDAHAVLAFLGAMPTTFDISDIGNLSQISAPAR
ncbi:hypothetical protein GCM10008020_38170 [Massilia psychrophila]|nr:hypothetical protein GCM10008020_38170 [Massilia psychrophila]